MEFYRIKSELFEEFCQFGALRNLKHVPLCIDSYPAFYSRAPKLRLRFRFSFDEIEVT